MDRRTTLKWVLAAAAAMPALRGGLAQAASLLKAAHGRGYGSDPDLSKNYRPGELWPLTFSPEQRALAAILADLILPADERSPSASSVGVVDFIDEWISAPYPSFQRDGGIVLGGFAWLDEEAGRRYGQDFGPLEPASQRAICDDICDAARSGLPEAARFFALYRDLAAGGFYSTPIGRKDLGYIGNVPLTHFEGAPPALLQKLGLSGA